jgi:hypothetical protein
MMRTVQRYFMTHRTRDLVLKVGEDTAWQ